MKGEASTRRTENGGFDLQRVNVGRWEWRDLYHWLLTLSWPRFAACLLGAYLAVNAFFAMLFLLAGATVDGVPRGTFWNAFFFGLEAPAITVGSGRMDPAGSAWLVVATFENAVWKFGAAVMTGLIFVRFSRPAARLLFSRVLIVAPFDGQPALMLRVANQRHQAMVKAEFRLMLIRHEPTREDPTMRRFHALPLQIDYLVVFPAAVTIRHLIDERSPLHGVTAESLARSETRFLASVDCVDKMIWAPVQGEHSYTWEEVRFDEQFAEIYHDRADGGLLVDYSRLHETEPLPPAYETTSHSAPPPDSCAFDTPIPERTHSCTTHTKSDE